MIKVKIIKNPLWVGFEEINQVLIGVKIPLSKHQPINGDFVVYVTDTVKALRKKNKKAADWLQEWVRKNLGEETPGIKFAFEFIFTKNCAEVIKFSFGFIVAKICAKLKR